MIYHVTTTRFSTGVFEGTGEKTTEWTFKSKARFLQAMEQWATMDPAEFTVTIRTEKNA